MKIIKDTYDMLDLHSGYIVRENATHGITIFKCVEVCDEGFQIFMGDDGQDYYLYSLKMIYGNNNTNQWIAPERDLIYTWKYYPTKEELSLDYFEFLLKI